MTTTPTEPTADPLADLLEADAETMEGVELAAAVARIRGYRGVYRDKQSFHYFDPEPGEDPDEVHLWAASYDHDPGFCNAQVPRPDRDAAAAVALLEEGRKRFGIAEMYTVTTGEYGVRFEKARFFAYGTFLTAVTRAYFRAWQEEKRAVIAAVKATGQSGREATEKEGLADV